jgi:hypothetical protein
MAATALRLMADQTPHPTMAEMAKKIAAQEEAYSNLEVHWSQQYEYGQCKHPLQNRVTSFYEKGRLVTQGELFRIDRTRDLIDARGKPVKATSLAGFDGEQTRHLEQNEVANVYLKRSETRNEFFPHRVPYRRDVGLTGVRLSSILKGTEEIRSDPCGAQFAANRQIKCKYDGEESVDGLKCCRIVVESSYHGDQGGAFELYETGIFSLAIDRNFLPIACKWFCWSYSKDLPSAVARMDRLKEIRPGLWYPQHCEITSYDRHSLRDDRKPVILCRNEFLVEDVKLDPKYPRSFFQDVPFEKGTYVYWVDNGKVTRSERIGYPKERPRVPVGSRRWIVMVVSGLLSACAATIAITYYRRRHSRPGQPFASDL